MLDNPNIITAWKWQGNRWQAYSPDSHIQQILEANGFHRFDRINRLEGFWVNARQDFSMNICNDTLQSPDWLVLVYFGADNNLDSFANRDLNEISQVHYSNRVKVIALVDNLSGSYIYGTDESGNFHLLREIDEVDTGNPQTLENFVRTYVNQYHPHHLALIIWDHGDQWRSLRTNTITKIAAQDVNNNDLLHLEELQEALRNLQASGIHIDLLGFDACLMSSVETLNAVKDYANVIVASELTEPGDGWFYTPFLNYLVQHPDTDVFNLGKKIVDSYVEYYSDYPETVTLAAISNNTVSELLTATNRIAQVLENHISDVESIRAELNSFYGSVDLYQLASIVDARYCNHVPYCNLTEPGIDCNCFRINLIFSQIYFRTNNADNYYHGVSIYFPNVGEDTCYLYGYCVDGYGETFHNTFGNSLWVQFLREWFNFYSPATPPSAQ